ncbi:PREDICTED: sodium-dependent noradrenaline transporter-like [Nicrophorus vespilloides]|uniref:Sodium-dependent noradrenaline transporter-like n=1 Tax=Nicrophorus vespilloides TaxID=110193 RepID=A0ABM1MH12_NICVS|nr:PREDICTED: sodium-dependent noradrenaline transporter-like [Nicrophorus vespilloides]
METLNVESGIKDMKINEPIQRLRGIHRKEPKFDRVDSNFWSKQYYYLFCIAIGNGVDGLPGAFRFAMDLSGAFFVLQLIFFTFLLNMPIVYMEIFLGKYTRLTNCQMYKMAPLFFGYCVLLILFNIVSSPMRVTDISLFIISALQLIINPNYLYVCPHDSNTCLDYEVEGNIGENRTCSYNYMSFKCDNIEYRYVSAYLYWNNFRNFDDPSTYALWQCVIAAVITWMFITFLCLAGMKVIGILLKITFVVNFVIMTILLIMALPTHGSMRGLMNLIEFRVQSLHLNEVLMGIFLSSMKLGLTYPIGYMTYAAYTDKNTNVGPATEAVFLNIFNVLLTIYYLVVLHAIAGVLSFAIGVNIEHVMVPFAGVYCAMIPEFLRFRDTPIIFIIIYHLSNWTLEMVKIAVIMYMQILNLYDFFPGISKYQTYVFLAAGAISLIISIFCSLRIFSIIIFPLLWYCEINFLFAIRLLGEVICLC